MNDDWGYPTKLVDKTYRVLVRDADHDDSFMRLVRATSKLEAIDKALTDCGYRGVENEVWILDDEKNFRFMGVYKLVERWTQI